MKYSVLGSSPLAMITMQPYLAILSVALMASTAKAGQILGAYNLISSPLVLPQTYDSLQFSHGSLPGIFPASQPPTDLAHPAVVENAIAESQLPPGLLNPFYKNPAIASALAKESWFTNKESPVRHREAERIPREEIYKIVSRLQHRRR
ncbi:hypothetical protein NQ317_018946 [Molorchus minor]|uniref:Uncharacterized protein n=1 Tax=Molorchus minor TaxID=1323400 RepID=A0ABQ9J890_9CUCU|nr:hypothetical protein NQ317_018946 [Molorchus minor]